MQKLVKKDKKPLKTTSLSDLFSSILDNLESVVHLTIPTKNSYNVYFENSKWVLLSKATANYNEESWQNLDNNISKALDAAKRKNSDIRGTLSKQSNTLLRADYKVVQSDPDTLVLTEKNDKFNKRIEAIQQDIDRLKAENEQISDSLKQNVGQDSNQITPEAQNISNLLSQKKELDKSIEKIISETHDILDCVLMWMAVIIILTDGNNAV